MRNADLRALGTPPPQFHVRRVIEVANLALDGLARIQQWPNRSHQLRAIFNQLCKVLKLARRDTEVRRFMTAPGVGPITASNQKRGLPPAGGKRRPCRNDGDGEFDRFCVSV
jgi:hypothetical protein